MLNLEWLLRVSNSNVRGGGGEQKSEVVTGATEGIAVKKWDGIVAA
jgi:hypothetical protein